MKAGDAFHFVRLERHLWIVLSDPEQDPHRVLLVNVTSWRADKEQVCLLNPGDHECVEHNSVINYEDARVVGSPHLVSLVASGGVILHESVSPALLHYIREKAAESKRMKTGHFQILLDQGLVDS